MSRGKHLLIILALCLLSVLISVLTSGCADKTWDYVALGDSYPAGLGVENSYVDYYAEFIEQDLGVQVEVNNFSRNY
jgi:hypothetical protein